MEEKTKILICLGAATAANCIPCFEFYYGKAQEAGISDPFSTVSGTLQELK